MGRVPINEDAALRDQAAHGWLAGTGLHVRVVKIQEPELMLVSAGPLAAEERVAASDRSAAERPHSRRGAMSQQGKLPGLPAGCWLTAGHAGVWQGSILCVSPTTELCLQNTSSCKGWYLVVCQIWELPTEHQGQHGPRFLHAHPHQLMPQSYAACHRGVKRGSQDCWDLSRAMRAAFSPGAQNKLDEGLEHGQERCRKLGCKPCEVLPLPGSPSAEPRHAGAVCQAAREPPWSDFPDLCRTSCLPH